MDGKDRILPIGSFGVRKQNCSKRCSSRSSSRSKAALRSLINQVFFCAVIFGKRMNQRFFRMSISVSKQREVDGKGSVVFVTVLLDRHTKKSRDILRSLTLLDGAIDSKFKRVLLERMDAIDIIRRTNRHYPIESTEENCRGTSHSTFEQTLFNLR